MMETIEIRTDFIKLDALLKFAALVPSGGEAKRIITEGNVSVNDEICTMRGKKIFPGDVVQFENTVLRIKKNENS